MKTRNLISSLTTFMLSLALIHSANGQDHITKGPENGTLIIWGGGGADLNTYMGEFETAVKHDTDVHIVFIPTAMQGDTLNQEHVDLFTAPFRSWGFTNVSVLHTRDSAEANTEEFIEPLKTAGAVVLSGGRHWRFTDAYLGTKTHEALFEVLERGGVIVGGSAGATVQGSFMPRADTKTSRIIIGDHTVGFGFISNIAIDQHHLSRNRQFDMFEILKEHPELLGLGIDERTGIVVKENQFRVIGERYVAIYDGTIQNRTSEFNRDLPKGSKEFYFLREEQEYDMSKRKIVTFEDRTFINLSSQELAEFAGTYTLYEDTVTLDIELKDDTLRVTHNFEAEQYTIHPQTKLKFYGFGADWYLEFYRNKDGNVAGFGVPAFYEAWRKN